MPERVEKTPVEPPAYRCSVCGVRDVAYWRGAGKVRDIHGFRKYYCDVCWSLSLMVTADPGSNLVCALCAHLRGTPDVT